MESRRVYANIINFRISGNIRYLMDVTTPKTEIYRKIIRLTPNEVYVDLGAYNGDTIEEVLQHTRGKYIRIYAVEPDRKNFKKLCKYLDGMNYVYAYNAVAWCLDTRLPFSTKAGPAVRCLRWTRDDATLCGQPSSEAGPADPSIENRM